MHGLGNLNALKPAKRKEPHMICKYMRQSKALGLGHAVLCAEPLVGNETFAVLPADDLMIRRKPILQQMVQQYRQSPHTIPAVQSVPLEDTKRYSIVDVGGMQSYLVKVRGMVEKPRPDQPSPAQSDAWHF